MATTIHGMTIHSTNRVEDNYINACVTAYVNGSHNADNMLRNLGDADMMTFRQRVDAANIQKLVEDVQKDVDTAHNILAGIIGEA